jgi:hypothetical protein
MEENKVKKQFVVEGNADVVERLERFLALLNFNSSWGHSALFAMPLDGDGPDRIRISGIRKGLAREVELIGGVGYDVEVALDDCYSGKYLNREKEGNFKTGQKGVLFKGLEIHKERLVRDPKDEYVNHSGDAQTTRSPN